MDALLRTCDAVIHHGGFGTTMAALCEGLPQLVLPQGSDHFSNAALLHQPGAGMCGELTRMTTTTLTTFLADRCLRDMASAVKLEIAAMPPPSSLVPSLVALVC